MIEVTLCVQLTGEDGGAVLERTVTLPCLPPRGLLLAGLACGQVEVQTVVYDLEDGSALVELEPETDPTTPLADLLAAYGPGWEILDTEDRYELTDPALDF